MKKLLKAGLTGIAALAAAFTVAAAPWPAAPKAEAFSVGTRLTSAQELFYWNEDTEVMFYYTVENGTAKITDYYANDPTDELTIPEELEGYPVTAIGSEAFSNNSNFNTVIIPTYIDTIENSAFYGCSSLEKVIISSSIKDIPDYAFYGCDNLNEVKIGGAEHIGTQAFGGCSSLTELEIPPCVETIDEYAYGFFDDWDYGFTGEYDEYGDPVYDYVPIRTASSSITGISGTKAERYANASKITFNAVEVKNISAANASLSVSSFEYTGGGIWVDDYLTVIYNGTELVKDVDYYVSYGNNIDVGYQTAVVEIRGINFYTDQLEKNFTIRPVTMAKPALTTGSSKLTVKWDVDKSNTGYQILIDKTAYFNSADKHTINIVGSERYASGITDYVAPGEKWFVKIRSYQTVNGVNVYSSYSPYSYLIVKGNVSTVATSAASYVYRGVALSPGVTVKDTKGNVLVKNTDYTAVYTNNTNVGTATVKITGKGSYQGSISKTFKITKLAINTDTNVKAVLSAEAFSYCGTARTPKPALKYGNYTIPASEYTVTYSNNINVGTAKMVIKANSTSKNISGSITRTFKITKLNINNSKMAIVIPTAAYAYTGSLIKPTVTSVKWGNYPLKTTDYTVSYSKNKVVGLATITVTAKGNNTTGAKSRSFKIIPAKTTGLKISTTGTTVRIDWTKSGCADGYEVYWCKGCDDHVTFFTGGDDFYCWNTMVKAADRSGISSNYYIKKSLVNSTVYHFKVRAYKVVNGSRYYGAFSEIKNSVAAESRLNGATVGSSRTSYKLVNYITKGTADETVTLTAEEKQILANFAKAHFKSGWTPAQKVIYTANWIYDNFTYLYGDDYTNAMKVSYSNVKRTFYYKSGQCIDYNGALVAMMNYLGYDVRLIQGQRLGSSGTVGRHYWGEITIGGYNYIIEAGESQWGSDYYRWAFLCERYFEVYENSTGYLKFGQALKNMNI